MIYQQINKRTAKLSLATSHIAHWCNQLNHVALLISMPRFKSIIFYKTALKLSYFCKKMQNFRAVGVPAPHPCASGGWGLRAHTPRPPKQPPHCEFLTTCLVPGTPCSDGKTFCGFHLYLPRRCCKNLEKPRGLHNVNPARAITWFVGVTNYCTIFQQHFTSTSPVFTPLKTFEKN